MGVRVDSRLQQMLPAREEDLGARYIGKVRSAELEDDAGDFGGGAHAAHGNPGDEGFVFGADHGGFDFAGGHGIHTHAQGREFAGHFAGQS